MSPTSHFFPFTVTAYERAVPSAEAVNTTADSLPAEPSLGGAKLTAHTCALCPSSSTKSLPFGDHNRALLSYPPLTTAVAQLPSTELTQSSCGAVSAAVGGPSAGTYSTTNVASALARTFNANFANDVRSNTPSTKKSNGVGVSVPSK